MFSRIKKLWNGYLKQTNFLESVIKWGGDMQAKQRTVFLVTEQQHQKIVQIAKEHNISIGEVGRRAIDAYNPTDAENHEIDRLAELVLEANQKTLKAVREARKDTKAMLQQLRSQD